MTDNPPDVVVPREATEADTLAVLLDNVVIAQSLSRELRERAHDEARAYLYDRRKRIAAAPPAPAVDREAVAQVVMIGLCIFEEAGSADDESAAHRYLVDGFLALLAPPAHREADGDLWQDIATAPRDGTWLVLEGEFSGGDTSSARVGRWNPVKDGSGTISYEWQVVDSRVTALEDRLIAADEFFNWYCEGRVSGWQPLPAPPTPRAMTQGEG